MSALVCVKLRMLFVICALTPAIMVIVGVDTGKSLGLVFATLKISLALTFSVRAVLTSVIFAFNVHDVSDYVLVYTSIELALNARAALTSIVLAFVFRALIISVLLAL